MSLSATGRPRSGLSLRPGVCAALRARFEVERDEGADVALALGDGVGAKLDRLRGRELAGFDGAGKTEG